jgi:hypothetical protein
MFGIFLRCSAVNRAKTKTVSPRKLVLNLKEITLYVGEEEKLSVKRVRPSSASTKVNWSVKNKKIADVSKSGKLTAKSPGKTVIVASSQKKSSVKATVTLTVKKVPEKVEKECSIIGGFYRDQSEWVFKHINSGCTVVRSMQEFQNVIKEIKKRDNSFWLDDSVLSKYRETDFEKESLVFLYCLGGGEIASLYTQFDEKGRLKGVITLRNKKNQLTPEEKAANAKVEYVGILMLEREDEMMIDYYEIKDK